MTTPATGASRQLLIDRLPSARRRGGGSRKGAQTRSRGAPPPMHEPTDDFLHNTRTFWQSRTDRQLTTEDARQIAENVTGFLQTLIRWHRDDRDERGGAVSKKEDIDSPGTSPTRNRRGEKKPPRKKRSAGTSEPLTPVRASGHQPDAEGP